MEISGTLAEIIEICSSEGLGENGNAERLASAIAEQFEVRPDEVGLLRLNGKSLEFAFPSQLRGVGSIPLTSTSSVAANTASNKRAQVFNNFSAAKHATVFESVTADKTSAKVSERVRNNTIHKLISAPVLHAGHVVGVVQVSRKGANGASAGKDFTMNDLKRLIAISHKLAPCLK
jgi:hypothetical protein